MFRQVVDANTETASALVDYECSGLEGSDYTLLRIVEILKGDEVLQQSVEVSVYEQQGAQRFKYCFCGSECIGISCFSGNFGSFPIGNLLSHLEELLLGHTGFRRLFGDECQTYLLQFLLLKISGILRTFLLVSSDNIRFKRSSRNGLFFNSDSSNSGIDIGKSNDLFIRSHFLSDFGDCLVCEIGDNYLVFLLKE